MSRPYTIDVTQEGYNHLKDRSLSLRFRSVKEVSRQDMMVVIESHLSRGALIFSPDDGSNAAKKIATKGEDGLTPSQRLREALYTNWQECIGEAIDFEEYYSGAMERITKYVERYTEQSRGI